MHWRVMSSEATVYFQTCHSTIVCVFTWVVAKIESSNLHASIEYPVRFTVQQTRVIRTWSVST